VSLTANGDGQPANMQRRREMREHMAWALVPLEQQLRA